MARDESRLCDYCDQPGRFRVNMRVGCVEHAGQAVSDALAPIQAAIREVGGSLRVSYDPPLTGPAED